MEKHALLSASTAHRWLTCTPSARLEQLEGTQECSVYAAEGTAAHALAELKLSYTFGKIGPMEYQERLQTLLDTPEFAQYHNAEFEEYVDSFVKYVIEQTEELKDDYHIYFETRVDFSNFVPQGFGTADVMIVTNDMVHVIDLKFGVGVPVSAINNPQLRLYALGALNMFPLAETIKMTINQPRLESHDTEILSKRELIDWALNVVVPRAEEAIKGDGTFIPSEQACKFCKLKGSCKVRADRELQLAQQEFRQVAKTDITKLSTEQLSNILQIAPVFIDWFKDVQAYALGQLTNGVKIPQFKLVEGRSIRVITDEEKVKQILLDAGYAEEDILKPREMRGLSALEALVGKKQFAELTKDYVIKPRGKLTLAPESDRRPEVNSAEFEFGQTPIDIVI